MNTLTHSNLKQATFVCNHYKDKPKAKRYLIESRKDFTAFLKVFTNLKSLNSTVKKMQDAIDMGKVLVFTDNSIAGFPTYCYESENGFLRIKS